MTYGIMLIFSHKLIRKQGKTPSTAKSTTIFLCSMAALFLGIGVSTTAARAATAISACPYTIAISGDYVISKNLAAAGTCITIAANTVTINLQGHSITGNGAGFGITDGGSLTQEIVIANGTVQKFDTGIAMNFSHPVTITGITSQNNQNQGIALYGDFSVISTRADNNGADGIRINGALAGSISASEASGNGGNGIVNLTGPTFVALTVTNANALAGISLSAQGGNQVTGSLAIGNHGNGIDLSAETGNIVTDSTARQNQGAGIILLCPGNAVSNTAKQNVAGNLVEVPGQVNPPSPMCINFSNTAP